MIWIELENGFNRALRLSFSYKKIILTFSVLLISGLLWVLCRALSLDATPWLSLSLTFLPIFLSAGLFLALGVILSRIYLYEMKQIAINVRRLITISMDLILGISKLSVPILLLYLVFLAVLGLFFLLKEIPGIGEFFSVIFSFAPFLLIFGSLVLCLLVLFLFFFVPPAATLQSMRKSFLLVKRVLDSLKNRYFTALILLLIGLTPLLLVFGLLCFSASLTNTHFFLSKHSLSVAMQGFFLMIPFSALLTPPVIFFFNFSSESYTLLNGSLCE